jgi:hypothetical protein
MRLSLVSLIVQLAGEAEFEFRRCFRRGVPAQDCMSTLLYHLHRQLRMLAAVESASNHRVSYRQFGPLNVA